jgi:hypothetical protein
VFAAVFVGSVSPPVLLLDVLPFLRRARRLPLESFDRLPMLFRGSLTVAPLNPVDVGDDWLRCDDGLEGTLSRPRPFLELDPSSGDNWPWLDISALAEVV